MLKTYKVRVFYNAWQDVELQATGEYELKELVQSLDTDNVHLSYDFFEELEENGE
jgi:hypothetical protein